MNLYYRQYASVLLDVSIRKPLDYGIPEELIGKVARGSLVRVPLKNGFRHATVLKVKSQTDYSLVKPIESLVEEAKELSDELFDLALWMAEYYCTPLEDVLKIMIPSSIRGKGRPKEQLYVTREKGISELIETCQELRQKNPAQAEVLDLMIQVKKGIFLSDLLESIQGKKQAVQALVKKGLLKIGKKNIDRSPIQNEEYFQTKAKPLTDEQSAALEKINRSISENKFEPHLLYGITGSGKTEVYLQAIQKALDEGKGALMLVPEISLTAQTIERFKSRFEDKIAVLHYRLSHGERYDEWMKISRGEAPIVIGARSSIFSPVKNLGLIIIDEEHDASYKQSDSMPCYNARDVGVMRAMFSKIPIILGSATPSLETFYNSSSSKYTLSALKKRAMNASLPSLKVIDMRKEFEKAKSFTLFSEELLNAIEKRIENGEKTILFLNRRGYHTTLMCKSCGSSVKCAHCDLSMTFHLSENRLSCHLCGFEKSPPPKACPSCSSFDTMKFKGIGTENVEKGLASIFKGVRTMRIDRDTTKLKGSHQKLLRDFKSGKADILIGTQMVAKGLHFPDVTLVGILNCDSSLNIPDFRAAETTFQLITQVAGRSGRGALAGEVILQSAIPENSTIQHAASQDFEAFYKEEIEIRKAFNYPPFAKLAKIRFSGKDQERTLKKASLFREQLIKLLPKEVEIASLLPSGHAKVKDHFRFQFLLRGPNMHSITRALNKLLSEQKREGTVKCFIDINPLSTFF